MKQDQISHLLESITKVNVAVYGDFCLDAYWILNPKGGEISVETALQTQAVGKHYYTLGGASNVVANLAALKPAHIRTIGVVGQDIFGRELLWQLRNLRIDTSAMVEQKENFDTVTFGKRYLSDEELPRIDFGFFNKRSEQTDEVLVKNIEQSLRECDVLIINQQVPGSITNENYIDQVNLLFQKHNDKIVILDSRHYGDKFRHIWRKSNDIEAARLNGVEIGLGDVVTLSDIKNYAKNLYGQFEKPVFITRGSRGMIIADNEGIHQVPGIQILKKIDTVGAGDTTTSALALALAAGVSSLEAAEFANFAAAVTVQKLFQTGTSSGHEILELSQEADYIYQPELAEDLRHAEYLSGTEIELCYPRETIPLGKIKHAVFDHDGTISTIREGWEHVMRPVMVKAILGGKYDSADETLYHKVVNRVSDYIDKSTGVQTIIQMESLVEMVREFGVVPENRILDKFGYKQIYNQALMEMVNRRIKKFKDELLDINDYTIKGAVSLLEALRNRKIKLYLASGSDKEDVINEATVLGYAELFDGGIYGAVGDIAKYSKKIVLERIMNENNLEGPEVVVFGDGPVEIKECRKRNGIAIGIASDEIRRHDLNREKRARLIKAGSQIIIPDFSQYTKLVELICSG